MVHVLTSVPLKFLMITGKLHAITCNVKIRDLSVSGICGSGAKDPIPGFCFITSETRSEAHKNKTWKFCF